MGEKFDTRQQKSICIYEDMHLVSAGLLVPLTDELSHPEDPLGCAAGLQLVTQLAQQSGPAAIGFLGDNLVGSLRGLVAHGDAFLRSSALQVFLDALYKYCPTY